MRSLYEREGTGAYEQLGTPLPLADWPNDRRILFGREVVEERVSDESMDPVTRSAMIENGELSALSVPLWFEGEPVGILVLVETRDARRFSEHEFELARGLGEQAAVAIHNAHLYRRLERQNSKLSALLGSSRALTSTVVLEEVLHTLAAVAAEALSAPSCYIYEYDAAGDAILWRSEYHSHPEHRDPDPPGTRYPLDDYPWDRDVLASGRMRLFTIDDPTLPPAQAASMRDWDELSMLTVPLRFGDETVGMMEIAESRPERSFDTDEIELARALGEQAAAAIRNAQLYRRETLAQRAPRQGAGHQPRRERLARRRRCASTASGAASARSSPTATTRVDMIRLDRQEDRRAARARTTHWWHASCATCRRRNR